MTHGELKQILGETIHTAFRKGCDCPQASIVWNAINEMSPEYWDGFLEWVIWALNSMGLSIRKKKINKNISDKPEVSKHEK